MNQKCLEFYEALKARELSHKQALISAMKSNQTEAALGEKSQKMLSVFQTLLKISQDNTDYLMKTED